MYFNASLVLTIHVLSPRNQFRDALSVVHGLFLHINISAGIVAILPVGGFDEVNGVRESGAQWLYRHS